MSAPTGLIITPPALAEMPFVETIPFYLPNAVGAPGANVCCYFRVRVPKAIRTTTVKFWVGATNTGNVDVGVCSIASGGAITKLTSSGSTAVGSTNAVQSIALAFDWVPGVDYWATIAFSDVATTARHQHASGLIGALDNMSLYKSSGFPIADQAGGATGGNNVPVWMRFV